MIALQRILVPTDFSECSGAALKYACELGREFDSRLHWLHVMQDLYIYPAGEAYIAMPTEAFEELVQATRDRMVEMLSDSDRHRFQVQLATPRGNPFVEIVRYAKDNDIDLVVIGTHGRGPIPHMLMGSVAEKVVRKAPCPVLVVRERQHEFVMP